MKKIFTIGLLALLLTGCSDSNFIKIDDFGYAKDIYSYSLYLNESVSFEIKSWTQNEQFVNMLDNNQVKLTDSFVVEQPYDFLEITSYSFESYSIKCTDSFSLPVSINSIKISNEHFEFTFSVDLKITYNAEHYSNSPFVSKVTYFSPSEKENEKIMYLSFNPRDLGYSSKDIVTLQKLESQTNLIEMIGLESSFCEYGLDYDQSEFLTATYASCVVPFDFACSGGNTYLKMLIKKSETCSFENVGFDFAATVSINGDVQTTFIHALYSESL